MTLLCRTAANLYWAGRHLERAEALARVVREHTALMVDLPTRVPLGWDALLAIPGTPGVTTIGNDERAVMQRLLADLTNPSSLAATLGHARENLRTTRPVLPRGTWRIVNELTGAVRDGIDSGVRRSGRDAFCERIIASCQRLDGFLAGGMSRDETWNFYRLGVAVERTDMVTRVLDVRAGALVGGGDDLGRDGLYRDAQWMSLLRSLDALQMYRRTTGAMIEPRRVLRFVLHDGRFPRSLRFGLDRIDRLTADLPPAPPVRAATDGARATLEAATTEPETAEALSAFADRLQTDLIVLDGALDTAYFTGAEVVDPEGGDLVDSGP